MNIQRMQYVLKVIDSGSIAEAARQLFISPSALSQCIMAEEKEHNIIIFNRRAKPLKLTPQGKIYHLYATELLHYCNKMNEELQESTLYSHEFEIKIGVARFLQEYLFSSILPDYTERYPNAKFSVLTVGIKKFKQLILKREIDFAITGVYIPGPEVTNIELCPYSPVLLLAPPEHPIVKKYSQFTSLESRPIINLTELKNDFFILGHPGDNLREIADFYFQQNHFLPKIRAEISSSASVQLLVNLGLGFGFINTSNFLLKDIIPIRYFKLQSFPSIPERKIYFQTYYRNEMNKPVKYLFELLKKNMGKLQVEFEHS